jgi:hypothetical protein
MGCTDPARQLEKRALEYRDAIRNADYVKLATYTLPAVIELAGGKTKFTEMAGLAAFKMEAIGIFPKRIELEAPGSLLVIDRICVSIIPSHIPVRFNDKHGTLMSSVIAFSEDKGENWYFSEATDQVLTMLETDYPVLKSRLSLPAPRLSLSKGDGHEVLVKQDGTWQKLTDP